MPETSTFCPTLKMSTPILPPDLICVTRLSATSSTVTGSESPSSVKTRVMPTLRPTNPKVIFLPFFQRCRLLWVGGQIVLPLLLQLDLYIDSGGQIELHQRVHRLVGGVDDVHEAKMRPDLELVARGLVRVRAAQHVEAFDARRQRHGALHDGPRALGRIHDLERRLVDQPVVERLQPDPDFLALHGHYSITFATTPAPTVLPPSRMAKRKPCSIAIGAIKLTTIFTLSPGITISVPAGSSQLPVTSVVLK